MVRLDRRQFLQGTLGLGSAYLSGCSSLHFAAPAPKKMPRVGWIGAASGTGAASVLDPFRQGLRDHSYIEGENLVLDIRLYGAVAEGLSGLAAELVGLPVDVIATPSLIASAAIRDLSEVIPIVAIAGSDPVQAGLAASFGHPGGNVTGVTAISYLLSGKRLALLKEAVPTIGRVGVLWNQGNPVKTEEWNETERTARVLGLEVVSLGIRRPDDFDLAAQTVARERLDAIIAFEDPLTIALRLRLTELLLASRIPSMFEFGDWPRAGGLLSYGPDRNAMFRRAADYVDRILKGAKPADIPIEQPTVFDYVINLKTAQALGLTMPQSVLLQATELLQ